MVHGHGEPCFAMKCLLTKELTSQSCVSGFIPVETTSLIHNPHPPEASGVGEEWHGLWKISCNAYVVGPRLFSLVSFKHMVIDLRTQGSWIQEQGSRNGDDTTCHHPTDLPASIRPCFYKETLQELPDFQYRIEIYEAIFFGE